MLPIANISQHNRTSTMHLSLAMVEHTCATISRAVINLSFHFDPPVPVLAYQKKKEAVIHPVRWTTSSGLLQYIGNTKTGVYLYLSITAFVCQLCLSVCLSVSALYLILFHRALYLSTPFSIAFSVSFS